MVTLDEALAQSAELFQSWVDDETVGEDELDPEIVEPVSTIEPATRSQNLPPFGIRISDF